MNCENIIIGIGAIKGGTTWMHGLLSQHPTVVKFPIKEWNLLNEWAQLGDTSLVDRFRAQGLAGSTWAKYWTPQITTCLQSLEYWKKSEFFDGKELLIDAVAMYLMRSRGLDLYPKISRRIADRFIVDFTPEYAIAGPVAIDCLKQHAPGARIVYCIREPIGRLISYLAMIKVPHDDLDESYMQSLLNRHDIINHTLYRTNIDTWARCFPAEQILIVPLSDFRTRHERTLYAVQKFCGLRYDVAASSNRNASLPAFSCSVANRFFPVFKQFILGFEEEIFIPSRLSDVWRTSLMDSGTWTEYEELVTRREDELGPALRVLSAP
jgi:hypothetical protein